MKKAALTGGRNRYVLFWEELLEWQPSFLLLNSLKIKDRIVTVPISYRRGNVLTELEYFKNFNIGKEIDLAGTFAYNALSILNTTQDVYLNDQIFMFLYNASVSVERMQKCVLFMYGSYNGSEIEQFAETIKIHDHQNLQCKINSHTKKKLSEEQNALLILLRNFYADGRYSNYSTDNAYDYKSALENFVKHYYDASMVKTHFFRDDTYISEEAKERIGRTLGKLLCYYYDLIKEKAHELNLYTYELRDGSPAERVFLNTFPKNSLQAINASERNALAELIVYLITNKASTGYLNYVRGLEPLDLDPHLVPEYLADIMNRQIPQSLVDEVESIYENMPHKQVIGNDLFSSRGIPLYFIQEVQGMDEEDIADLIQECQAQISRTLFNKNNKSAFWILLEEIMTTLEKDSAAGIRVILGKLSSRTKNRLFTLDETALLYLIALVKEGLKSENS